ncbi:restriction endonuclease subunit S [Tamlana sp. 2_MG-2023]|uniref:restriction endonuclease subunit S n=1 Tax=unclassified Tamlana TaxID=2614803 RepID=UPI0026E1A4BA|nr:MULTISPECIES: restriction endonuclease subunit S [unclassified Tamlana]MDO6761832.1 restriction endonuclease subunit S [Tamlana sp. 2_MG-2023]MDO6792605.1 restriction endonuclease subunit S [Tamlana sp. 1_MG-2023]
MQLLQHFKELTIRPKNVKELKSLIVKLALEGKLTQKWRGENKTKNTGLDLLNSIKVSSKDKIDKLSKRDSETKNEILESFSKTDLPNSWTFCVLHDLANFWNGKAHEKGVDENGDFFLVNSRFVSTNGERFKRTNLALSPLKIDNIAIVMSDVPNGRALARCFLVKEDNKYTLNQRIGGVTLFEGINPEFMVLVLDRNQHYLDVNDGKKQSNLKRIQMISCPIPLPPLEEQKEIVNVVETLFKEVEQLEQLTVERIALKEDFVTSALNQLTTNNANQEWAFLQDHFKSFFNETTNIKKLRETVLQLAVQGKLTTDWRASHPELISGSHHASQLLKRIQEEKAQLIKDKKIKKEKALPKISEDEIPYELPDGWVWCRFQQIFDIRDGTHDSPSYISGPNTYPLVTSKDFKNGEISFEKAKRISKEDYDKINLRSLVEEDDILFSMIGGNLGNQVMVKVNTEFAIKNVALFKYYKKSLSVPDYLKTFSEHIAYAVQEKASGGAQPFVSLTFLRQMLFPLPPLEEQKAIVQKVNALMGLCDRLEQEVQQSQEHSAQLMQSCLREVFEGERKMEEV